MVDIHTHILPGIDDGSVEIEESLEMAELALDGGTEYLIATPHSNQMGRFENFCSQELIALFRDFQEALSQEEIPLKTYLGMEIYATEDMEQKIRDGMLISLNQSRYYLVEFSFGEEPDIIMDGAEQIFRAGGIPVIAHPERYECVQHDPTLVYEWLQSGCFTQVNRSSILGRFGRRIQRTVDIMLKNRWVTCVASDAHSSSFRTPYMGDAADHLAKVYGERMAHRLMVENPMRILQNKTIMSHGKKPEWHSRFF